MQTDPIGQAGGMNIYAYVGGDPVNFSVNSVYGIDGDGNIYLAAGSGRGCGG
jgi:RHS repeat-associated protein